MAAFIDAPPASLLWGPEQHPGACIELGCTKDVNRLHSTGSKVVPPRECNLKLKMGRDKGSRRGHNASAWELGASSRTTFCPGRFLRIPGTRQSCLVLIPNPRSGQWAPPLRPSQSPARLQRGALMEEDVIWTPGCRPGEVTDAFV